MSRSGKIQRRVSTCLLRRFLSSKPSNPPGTSCGGCWDHEGRTNCTGTRWTAFNSKDAAHRVADVEGFHVVAVSVPVPRRRQERARAVCLTVLVPELHGFGVEQLFLETRTAELNRRDVATFQGARFALPRGSSFRVDHLPGSAEPLLWVADIVAGVVGASRRGGPIRLDLLGERVHVLEVPTGC